MTKLNSNLKQFRKKKKLTQDELAKKVQVRRETITHLERGRYNPSLILALRISKVLDIPVEDLFQLDD